MSGSAKMFQIAPTTFHGISSGSAISTRQTETQRPLRGMASAMATPSGTSISEDDDGEEQLAAAAPRGSASECSTSSNQSTPEEEHVVAEGLLHRVVDHRHQRDDAR